MNDVSSDSGMSDRHDERRPQVEQEDEEHQRHQHRALDQVVAPTVLSVVSTSSVRS